MRARHALVILGYLLLLAGARANDALILISPVQASAGPRATDFHRTWVRWAPLATEGSANQLLSIPTGIDWDADGTERAVHPDAQGRWFTSPARASLESRGYFDRRERWLAGRPLIALSGQRGPVSQDALLLALDRERRGIRVYGIAGPFPPGATLVHRANSWDEVRSLSDRISGRTLVVEYPPPRGRTWSRLWLMGKSWPSGVPTAEPNGVPGLYRSRQLLNLLRQPEAMSFREVDDRMPGPGRWIEHVFATAPWTLAWLGVLGGILLFTAALCLATERNLPVGPRLIRAFALLPIALLIAGNANQVFGLESEGYALVTAYLLVAGLETALRRILARFWSPLGPIGCLGTIAWSALSTHPTVFSEWFGWTLVPFSPERVGFLSAYLAVWLVSLRPVTWLPWAVGGLTVAWIGLGSDWWRAAPAVFLPISAAVLAGVGWFRAPMLVLYAAQPLTAARALRSGFGWAPAGLNHSARDADAINLAAYAQFAISPNLILALSVVGISLLFGGRFLVYQMRRNAPRCAEAQALGWVAGATGAVGLTEPLFLPTAILLLFAAGMALLHEALSNVPNVELVPNE